MRSFGEACGLLIKMEDRWREGDFGYLAFELFIIFLFALRILSFFARSHER